MIQDNGGNYIGKKFNTVVQLDVLRDFEEVDERSFTLSNNIAECAVYFKMANREYKNSPCSFFNLYNFLLNNKDV